MRVQWLKILARCAMALTIVVCWSGAANAQWTDRTSTWPAITGHLDTCLVQTDGTVMCHEWGTNRWHKLTPDNNGSYLNGSWTLLATMPNGTDTSAASGPPPAGTPVVTGPCAPCTYAPTFFASAVLPNGHVLVIGGEYNSNGNTWTNIGFVYDPVANTWSSQITEPFGTGNVGDAQFAILPNGTMLLANISNSQMASFNEATNTFTAINPTGKLDRNDEEAWNLLPNGKILTIDSGTASSFEIYDPATNSWSAPAGGTPVNLADVGPGTGNSSEVGPLIARPDGTIIAFSGNSSGLNAIYDTTTGAWTAAPATANFPLAPDAVNHYAVADGPAAALPNGHVLVQASPVTNASPFNPPSHFFEFDGTNLTQVADLTNITSLKAFHGRMVVLPDGGVLFTGFDQGSTDSVGVYTASGGPNDSWRPQITGGPKSVEPGTTYTISGKMFNGFSEGAAYGDDAQMATNYPLVRITNRATGHVFYARTFNHSRMGIEAVGSTEIITTNFETPIGMETGLSDLEVVANGIPSKKYVVNGPGLTLTGPLSLSTCFGSTATTVLNVCNQGKQDLVINNITSSSAQVTVDSPGYSLTISHDQCFPFQVHYTPTAAGTTNATLSIASNDPNTPSASVQVTAKSDAPSINITMVSSGQFANTCPGSLSDAPIMFVTNQGQCSLVISGISSNDSNFLSPSTTLPLTVGAGNTVPLPVRFQPVGNSCSNTTPRTGSITIASNDPAHPSLVKNVSGTVPCPSLNTTIANSGSFGNVCAGNSSDLTLQLMNQGQCNLNIASLVTSNPNFELPAGTLYPLVLSHDANVNIPIRFKPTGVCSETVPQTSNVTINSNDPVNPALVRPVSGIEGCPKIVLSPQNLTGIYAFPATVSDPTGNLGCYTDRQISISNAGSCPLNVTSLLAAPANTFNVINPTVPLSIGPGAAPVPVTIRFKPTNLTGQLPAAPDQQTGTFTIVSNDPAGPASNLCGEPTTKSGVRLLFTNAATTPYSVVKSLTLSSKGLSPAVNQKLSDVPLFTANICGKIVPYHLDNETLAPAGTTGSNPKASYDVQYSVGGKPGSTSFTLGQCEVKDIVLKIK